MAGGDSVTAWAQAVGVMTGNGQAVMVAEGHLWQRRQRLQAFVKRQNRVTS
jgi:hypothetical protein